MNEATPGKPRWLDYSLEKLLRPVQKLPVFADERTAKEQHRRVQYFALATLLSLMVTLGGALLAMGIAPQFPTMTLLHMVVTLPVVVAVLMYGFLYLVFVHGRKDDGDHPWRYAATKQGLIVKRRNGKTHEGTWAQWRFEGYRYMSYRGSRGVTGLDLSLNGETLYLDLKRIKGMRPHLRLARAVVQQLAVEGDK
jgi:hypothetical protein